MTYKPTEIETIIRNRIRISIAAWAYESASELLMNDYEYDRLSDKIDSERHIPTGRPELDLFFFTCFDRSTGMWIHKHPELVKIQDLCYKYVNKS